MSQLAERLGCSLIGFLDKEHIESIFKKIKLICINPAEQYSYIYLEKKEDTDISIIKKLIDNLE